MTWIISELNAVTDRWYENQVNDIFYDGAVLLYKLLPGIKVDGGKTLSVFLEYDNSNVGAYGNTTTIPTNRKDIINRADFRWAGYYASNAIDLDDKRQNSGDAAMVNLTKAKLDSIVKSIKNQMGSSIYGTASTGNDFLGLGDMFGVTGTSYGNIASESTWVSGSSSTVEAISFKVLQAMRRGATINDEKDGIPDLYITTRTLKDGFERSLHTQARYTDHNLAKAGFDNVLFGNAPVVGDSKQTSGICDALNLKKLDIMCHKDYNFTKPVWEHEVGTPDSETANIRWSGQLVCRDRSAHYRHTALTEPS